MTAIEHLRRLAAARIERQRAEQPYSGPSRVWTGPRSSYLEADLREKMRTYGAGLMGPAPADGKTFSIALPATLKGKEASNG